MTGYKYAVSVDHLEYNRALHPDADMIFTKMQEEHPDFITVIIKQLSIKLGLKEWGNKHHNTFQSKIKQLNFRDMFIPMNQKEIDNTHRASVLESHIFSKKKRDGTIKGQTVAGGNKQRDCISKEDASSSSVSTESMLPISSKDTK